MPISAGLSTPRSARIRRRPVSSSSSSWLISSNAVIDASSVRFAGLLPAPGFQNQYGGPVVHAVATEIPATAGGHHIALGFETGQPLIDHLYRHMVAAVQALAELSGPGTHVVLGVVHIQRQEIGRASCREREIHKSGGGSTIYHE